PRGGRGSRGALRPSSSRCGHSASQGAGWARRLKRPGGRADLSPVKGRLAVWLLPVLAASAIALAVPLGDTGDLAYFVDASKPLFSSGWADTYADPSLQVGPLQLLFFGAADLLGDAFG